MPVEVWFAHNVKKEQKLAKRSNAMEIPAEFSAARKLYPGTKRGDEVEWVNFTKKYLSWRDIVPKLLPAVEQQIKARDLLQAAKEFVPAWPNFQTWVNQCRWTEEIALPKKTMYPPKGAEARPVKPFVPTPEMVKSNLWILCLQKNNIVKRGTLHRMSFQGELPSQNRQMESAIETAMAYSKNGGEFTVIEADTPEAAAKIASKRLGPAAVVPSKPAVSVKPPVVAPVAAPVMLKMPLPLSNKDAVALRIATARPLEAPAGTVDGDPNDIDWLAWNETARQEEMAAIDAAEEESRGIQ
jgi:hypothetical protein